MVLCNNRQRLAPYANEIIRDENGRVMKFTQLIHLSGTQSSANEYIFDIIQNIRILSFCNYIRQYENMKVYRDLHHLTKERLVGKKRTSEGINMKGTG